ncbi:hypothetical protein GCM10011487_36430 [Steroidobacter agaridevorans]|uniref:Uncharacterized protein n=1 Tax=Steroidobacter agaridevorans TaxID=2695856 RepID=A0A829YFF3_9GAMM|nr:hypothetical protein [Steroidobacter agaridevorans]GFE81643.1 hypothetical protein GCM10011487_36430 [Steroidobacter agaridevorans]
MSAQPIDDQDVIGQLPAGLQQWLALERFHLHKVDLFQNRSRDPAFDPRYLPQNCGAFRLPCFWVRRKYLQIYGRQAANGGELQLFSGHGLDERVLLPIHPSSLDHYRKFLSDVDAVEASKQGVCIWAVPTSSTRTLLAWQDRAPGTALFVKTSLQSPMFGDRRLYLRTVGRSVGFSGLMQSARADLPATLDYLSESVGFVPRSLPDSGAIVRSIPEEIKQGRILVAPLFSLLGGDGGHVPLLLTLLERSGMPPRQLVEETLCAPFARLWLDMSLRLGLVLEAHAQDLMLMLAPDLTPLGRFLYRDFEGLQVDWELRRRRGLLSPADMPHAWSWRETYNTWGYPFSEFVWYKWRISLFNYLYFILADVETSLREWHERGLIDDWQCEPDEVTLIFSRHLFEALEEMFGIRVKTEYNVYRHLNRFLMLLLDVRKELLGMK